MTDYVTVTGPHNRHMDVHPAIQKAFPDRYPLVSEQKQEKPRKADKGD